MVSVKQTREIFSFRAEAWPFLIVWVLEQLIVFSLLLLLSGPYASLHFAEFALVFSVSKDLLASLLLSLHGQQFLSFFFVGLEHLTFSQLVLPLVHYRLLLCCIESLEMIWFNTMRGKARDFSGWVLSHEVVSFCEALVVSSLHLLLSQPSSILISFFLGNLRVGLFICNLHIPSCLIVLGLCLFEQLVEVLCLLVECIISGPFLLFVEFLLPNLLIRPISLL